MPSVAESRKCELFHVVFQLFPDRSVYGHRNGGDQYDDNEHDDERDETYADCIADTLEDESYDNGSYRKKQDNEEHRPFAAVSSIVAGLDRLHRILAFFDEEIVGERPRKRKHDSRDIQESESNQDREDHQTGCNEEFAHVATVFAGEDIQRIDDLSFRELCRQQRDGDVGTYIDIRYSDGDQKQSDGSHDRRCVLDADDQRILVSFHEIEFLHLHNVHFKGLIHYQI